MIGVGDNKSRVHHFYELLNMKLELITVIHPKTHTVDGLKIGKGIVIPAGATIATGVEVGNNAIINTGAIVEHENIIEDPVHISPGTVLTGRITVKKLSEICY